MTVMKFDSHAGWYRPVSAGQHYNTAAAARYRIAGRRRPAPAPQRTGPFADTSTHDLRGVCETGDPDAIAEWAHRNETGTF